MSGCKTLVRTSLSIRECRHRISSRINFSSTPLPQSLSSFSHLSPLSVNSISFHGVQFRSFVSMQGALPIESSPDLESISALEPPDTPPQDTVEHLLTNPDDVPRLMKMERKPLHFDESKHPLRQNRWFPYLDKFRCETEYLNSGEVLDAIGPSILDTRKERFKNAVKNRSYSVCLVVEGLCDFGNVSAAFRSADALGIQSVHVVSCDSSKRCNHT